MFEQTLEDVEINSSVISGFDLNFDKPKQFCGTAWKNKGENQFNTIIKPHKTPKNCGRKTS